jgi:DNA polymerase III delta prime subunit
VSSPRIRSALRAWASEWGSGATPGRRAAVLSGPPGVGKTTTALALAEENGWTVVEMNASDARNERAIEQVAGRASITHTLSTPGRRTRALILLDEADCLTGRLTETPRPTAAPPTLREFLRGRYGTIEALNVAWGLGANGRPALFTEWDDLPRAAGRAAWTRLPAAQRDLDDWRGGSRPADLSDRGGLGAIAKLVRMTRQPLILTVNDEQVLTRYSPVFRTGVLRVAFSRLRDADVGARVSRIAGAEGISLGPGVVEAIAKKARGDLRAALNDLEAIAPLPPGPAQLAVLGVRDLTSDLEELTAEALTAHRYYRSVEVQDRIDAPPDDLFPWIEENIPAFSPDPAHRAAAFQVLASADRMLQRARRYRVWSQWSYGSELQTGGVGIAIRETAGPSDGRVYFPEFLGSMGRSRSNRALRESIVIKGAHHLHLSKEKTRLSLLPFFEAILWEGAQPKARSEVVETARRLVAELELTPEEVAHLVGSEPGSPTVSHLLETGSDREAELPPPAGTEWSRPEVPSPAETASARKVQRSLSDFGS